MEKPFGKFGAMNPTGHAAVYLNYVCAESPTELRMCEPGEYGVVISRYHKIHKYDWIAIPLIPYLYAVEDATDIPLRRIKLGLRCCVTHIAENIWRR